MFNQVRKGLWVRNVRNVICVNRRAEVVEGPADPAYCVASPMRPAKPAWVSAIQGVSGRVPIPLPTRCSSWIYRYELTDGRVVIPSLQVVQAGFGVVVLTCEPKRIGDVA